MTGLDYKNNKIIEVAYILTDGSLQNLVEGEDLVIQTDKAILDNMDEWCMNHFTKNGLIERCLQSKLTL